MYINMRFIVEIVTHQSHWMPNGHRSPSRTNNLLTNIELTSPTAVYVTNLDGTSISFLLLAFGSVFRTLYQEYNRSKLSFFTICRVPTRVATPTKLRPALLATDSAVSVGRGTGNNP
ncbi:hypothetical protein AMECASPLE_021375 [Ameca splendens]|uniref:Uncharacterized protein n=1 Tax=Ameca splendens TaxID=208324 RepID=A0ABV0XSE2_9TELE